MHAADAHCIGQEVDTERGVGDILVDDHHDTLEQFLVGRLHGHGLHLVLQFVVSCVFQQQLASGLHQVDEGSPEDVHVERFHDIGVGAGLKSFEMVFVAVFGREQHDGNMAGLRVLLQGRRQCVAVHFRHHDIGEHQVGFHLQRLCQRLLSVGAAIDGVVVAEFMHEIVSYLVVVLCHHDDVGPVVVEFGHQFMVVEFLHRCGHLGGCRLFHDFIGGKVLMSEGYDHFKLHPL